jgi:hypothetical protein
MKNTRRHDLVTFPRSATDLIQTLNSKPSGGFYPRTRFASTFTEGEALKHPPGDISLMFASRPSPRARTGNYGDNRIRTGDPLLAKQVLYQLSYVPRNGHQPSIVWWAREDLNLRPHAYQACALTN